MRASLAKGILIDSHDIQEVISAIKKEKDGIFNPDYQSYSFNVSCNKDDIYVSLYFHYADCSCTLATAVCDYRSLYCDSLKDKFYLIGNVKRISLT